MRTVIAVLILGTVAWAKCDAREDAMRKLAAMRVSVDFRDCPLESAVAYLRDFTGLNLVIQSAGDASGENVRLTVHDLPVRSVLRLILAPRGLTATWRDGAIVILPREELGSKTTVRLYDVRAHLMKIEDFPGPEMELASPLESTGLIAWGIMLGFSEDNEPTFDEDLIVDLVRSHTGGSSWGNEGVSMDLVNGNLVVSQSPKVHREIERLLAKLLQYK